MGEVVTLLVVLAVLFIVLGSDKNNNNNGGGIGEVGVLHSKEQLEEMQRLPLSRKIQITDVPIE